MSNIYYYENHLPNISDICIKLYERAVVLCKFKILV